MAVKPIPEGHEGASPYIIVADAPKMIEFYKRGFGATEVTRMAGPDGRIGHAEIKIGKALIMLADEHPEMGILGPKSLGGARPPVSIHLYVEDVDALYRRAVEAGATSIKAPEDQFYGDRNAQLQDPAGHVWSIATHKEDVSPEEMSRRFDALTKPKPK
jgi:PhnB protein